MADSLGQLARDVAGKVIVYLIVAALAAIAAWVFVRA